MPERLLLQDVGPKKPQGLQIGCRHNRVKVFLNISQHKISIQDFCNKVLNSASHDMVQLVVAL